MAKTVKTKVLLRNDTARRWTSNNPTLGKGEIGIEIDTRKFKFGDGTKTWTQLPYASAADVSWNSANKKLVKDDGTVDIVRFTEGTGIDLTATAAGLQIAVDKTELALSAADIDLSSLVDTLTGTPGAGKTITAFDQVDGKVSATFGNISITKSQISDYDGAPNQNAFSNIAVSGQTTVAADTTTDTVTFVGGDNVIITTNATNDSVTFAVPSVPAADVTGLADVATTGAASDVATSAFTTGGGQSIAASTVQAEIERLSTSVENAVAGSGEVNIIEGVKLEGRTNTLPLASKIATIPNAVASGQTGATNGLMTAADKAKLDSVPDTQTTLVAGTGVDITESGSNLTISVDVSEVDVGVTDVTYDTSTHTLKQAKNGGTATNVHQFGEAAEKGVDTSIASGSSSTNVPTSAAVASAISTAISGLGNVFEYKGTVATVSALPVNPAIGDVYHVTADDNEYVWVGAVSGGEAAHWEPLGGAIDLSGYLTNINVAGIAGTVANGVATVSKADLVGANGLNLGAAAYKGVDTSMNASSTSTNVPTTAAVAGVISTAGQNYITAVAQGTLNGDIAVTKNGTTTQVQAYRLPATTLDSSDELILDCGDSTQEIPSR
jgi:hypothetical protein